MADRNFVVYFTGKDDPRDCIIIGDDIQPVFYEFQTSHYLADTRTTVSRYREGTNEAMAYLDWTMGVHLGRVTMGQKQIPMSEMLRPGVSQNARLFYSSDGHAFEWRRRLDDPNSYDLYLTPDTKVAAFRRFAQQTPVGPSHGYLQYNFSSERLLLDTLITLCLNRWTAWRGL